ncbi:MAG TPA: hypothetical protein VHF86_05635, partial [Xanthomonadaceae bacterium]|nr:hypothetical protein [Xanthomonadaceae bacterium]
MPRALSLLALACCVAACSRPQPAEPQPAAKPAPAARSADDREPAAGTRLTIYSGDYEQLSAGGNPQDAVLGFALVDRDLQYALEAGSNRIRTIGLPRTMDANAVTLRPLAQGVEIISQRYIAPPDGSRDVIAAAIGRKVAVEHTSGGAKQTDSGTLVSASGGLTIALGDGRIKVIREYDNFSIVDAGALLPQQAALQWTAQASRAGDARFELSYPMGGMAWRAEYLARLAPGRDCKLDLDGAALVANRSGIGFDDVRLTLVAGEPRRERREQVVMFDEAMPMDTQQAAAAPAAPRERASGEYHAYELPGSFQLSNGSTERVPLFARLQDVR